MPAEPTPQKKTILTEKLDTIAELSNKYGSDSSFVLAGGGNTSVKDERVLWIKPSGVPLATITREQFLPMDRERLDALFSAEIPAAPAAREERVKALMLAAVCPGSAGRPSVEAPLHNLFDATFVVHMHPALVNGMTCAKNGAEVCARLFPEAVWVPYTDPGYTLAATVKEGLEGFRARHGRQPGVVFLQNHGVFVAADSAEEIDAHYSRIMTTLTNAYKQAGIAVELKFGELDEECVQECAPRLRILMSSEDRLAVVSSAPFAVAKGPLSPDYIVYTKSYAYTGPVEAEALDAFAEEKGYRPIVVARPGAVFAAGTSVKNARSAMAVARDGALVAQLVEAFGGPRWMDDRSRAFIENWEVESYRKEVLQSGRSQRLEGKIAVVTGAAQGFGKGIAMHLADEGAFVVVADINIDGAREAADELCAARGELASVPVQVNITDEQSVEAMVRAVVTMCGGIDILVANAGVLRAGSVKTMELKDWRLVTDVNYTGYFLCVKYISRVMAAQNVAGRGSWMDIVQINSKSGLEGSNRNAAYAGSKFGTIGLTQSFAKELVEDKIKVNSICPGNYFGGPLWSDPDSGLFRQYLDTGKVPGAKTLDDVRRYYEAQVPMGRGCTPEDVARAIIYCVEQAYETGQAIPVTGGQVMLK